MPEDRDYDIVVGKLPRKDKDGKDTTGDKIGRGGRHREDGTYSSVVYDIEVVDNLPERNEVDYGYELERMAHEERMAEVQKSQSTAEAITSGLDFINTILTFLVENPEVLKATIDFGRKAKNGISSAKNKLVLAVRNGKQQKNKKVIKETVPETKIMDTVIVSQISTEIVPDDMDMSQIERENISVEKARELILGILMDYISLKKKLNRLSNANIDDIKRQELDASDVIAQLDSLIKQYPALMDDSTTENIMALLRMNSDKQENEVIKEVLKID